MSFRRNRQVILVLHERALVGVTGRLSPALLDRAMERRRDRLESVSARLGSGLSANVKAHEHRLLRALSRLSPEPLHRRLDQRAARLESVGTRLVALPRRLERDEARLAALARALAGLNPKTPKPGFARVESEDGAMIAAAAALHDGQAVRLVFADGSRGAHIDGDAAPPPARPRPSPAPKPKTPAPGQGDLF